MPGNLTKAASCLLKLINYIHKNNVYLFLEFVEVVNDNTYNQVQCEERSKHNKCHEEKIVPYV